MMCEIKTVMMALAILMCFGCSDSEQPDGKLKTAEPIPLKSEFVEKVQQDNTFTFDLLKYTVDEDEGENPNTFVSPLSVSQALGMALTGAKGETAAEMLEAMRVKNYTQEEVNEYYKFMREALLTVDESTQLKIANSLWCRSDFTLRKSYVAAIEEFYTKDVRSVEFSQKTLDDINRWVSDRTNGKIPRVLNEIKKSEVMFLVNAVYFKGIWREKFDKKRTAKEVFTSESGKTTQVDMMNITHLFKYANDEDGHYLAMPYGNAAFDMVLVLPQEGKQISDVLDGLTTDSWNALRFNSNKVNLKLPRFKAEFEYKLHKKILPAMGMNEAFTIGADFSGVSEKDICISKVIHKTALEVNEEGTEAAAATVVGSEITSAGPGEDNTINFFVDEPFLLFIKENSTGIILFAGKMGELGD